VQRRAGAAAITATPALHGPPHRSCIYYEWTQREKVRWISREPAQKQAAERQGGKAAARKSS